jgi:hypothetical protein
MVGCADRGCLGGFDRTPNAGKFPWGDRRARNRLSGGKLTFQQRLKPWIIAYSIEVGIGFGEMAIMFGRQSDGGGQILEGGFGAAVEAVGTGTIVESTFVIRFMFQCGIKGRDRRLILA